MQDRTGVGLPSASWVLRPGSSPGAQTAQPWQGRHCARQTAGALESPPSPALGELVAACAGLLDGANGDQPSWPSAKENAALHA